jgi:hypothetical protein
MKQSLQIVPTTSGLTEVDRLLTYIRELVTDSERTPITPPEVMAVANHIICQRIWDDPGLDQRLQEVLDDLRFRAL